jgi:hypothetical protein
MASEEEEMAQPASDAIRFDVSDGSKAPVSGSAGRFRSTPMNGADVFRFAPNIITIGRPRLALRAYYRCPSVRRRFKVIFCVRMKAVGMAGIEARLVHMIKPTETHLPAGYQDL